MTGIDRNFVLHALFWLVLGAGFSVWIEMTGNVIYAGVYDSLVLSGFVMLFVYGAVYRLWPELKRARLAVAQFWLAVISVPMMVLGSYLQIQYGSVSLAVAAAAASGVSALLLAWIFVGAVRSLK